MVAIPASPGMAIPPEIQTLTGISGQRQSRLTVAAVAAAITGVAVTLTRKLRPVK